MKLLKWTIIFLYGIRFMINDSVNETLSGLVIFTKNYQGVYNTTCI